MHEYYRTMQPNRLTILGVGLLGGSIGLAAQKRLKHCKIIGYAHRPTTLQAALACGAVNEGYATPAEAVRGADLVILCTPVGVLGQTLQAIAPALAPGAVVTDVGSTKRSIVAAAREHLPPGIHFVGSHPMAGGEKRGVRFARADLFEEAICILTPTKDTDQGALQDVDAFWRTLGMRTIRLSPEEHDRQVADVSHLPHALAAAMVAMQRDEAIPLAGKGFLDATRIAAGDGGLWRDIFIDNRDNLRSSIQRFQENLEGLLAFLDPQNAEALKSWLDEAAQRRQQIAAARPDPSDSSPSAPEAP